MDSQIGQESSRSTGRAAACADAQCNRWRTTIFEAARIVSIFVLSVAAALKFETVYSAAYGPPLHVAGQLAVILLELAMIGWLAGGEWPGVLRWVGALFWAVLALINGAYLIQGRGTCGCFGEVSAPPLLVMLLDLFLSASFVASQGRPVRRAAGVFRLAIWLAVGCVGIGMTLAVVRQAMQQWERYGAVSWVSAGLGSVTYGTPWDRVRVSRHLPDDLPVREGDWILVFYDARCINCQRILEGLGRALSKIGPGYRLGLMEVTGNPTSGPATPEKPLERIAELTAQLPIGVERVVLPPMTYQERHWFGERTIRYEVGVPRIIVLHEGKVVGSFQDFESAIAGIEEERVFQRKRAELQRKRAERRSER